MKKYSFIILVIFFKLSIYSQDIARDYIMNFQSIAVEEMKKTGIPASITLAQAMLESNYGKSQLALDANNHFGIKCGNEWTGGTFLWEDDDYVADSLIKSCFRVYNLPEESFDDHSIFLKNKSRYKSLFELDIYDYKGWAYGLSEAGYATDPSYPQKLITLIEKYNLTEFDYNLLPVNSVLAKSGNQINPVVKSINYKYINGSKVYIAQAGDSPSTVSKISGVAAEDILNFNDNINRKYQVFNEGDIVYLEKKKSDYAGIEEYYIAAENDNLQLISQKTGLDVKSLSDLNGYNKFKHLKKGQKIKLKNPYSETNSDKQSLVLNSSHDPKYIFEQYLTPNN